MLYFFNLDNTTSENDRKVQLQIHNANHFGNFFIESSFDKQTDPITLTVGHEYFIDVTPFGTISSHGLKELDVNDRDCLNEDENPIEGSIFKKYNERNCKFECRVSLAKDTCGCIPWDYKTFKGNEKECDVFGRTCFFAEIHSLTSTPENICSQCKVGCDDFQFRKIIMKDISTFDIAIRDHYLHNFLKKKNFMDNEIINLRALLDDAIFGDKQQTIEKIREGIRLSTIVIHVRFLKPEMDYADIAHSVWDKFANFGGNFGIFAEITGISFLGTVNCIILLIKLASSKILSKYKEKKKNKTKPAKAEKLPK